MGAESRFETEQMPIDKARDLLANLPELLAEEKRAIALTKEGEPVLALMSWDLFESLIETMEIMADPDMMPVVHRAIKYMDEESLIPLEKITDQLQTDEYKAGE